MKYTISFSQAKIDHPEVPKCEKLRKMALRTLITYCSLHTEIEK
jgi:hypothetical protein